MYENKFFKKPNRTKIKEIFLIIYKIFLYYWLTEKEKRTEKKSILLTTLVYEHYIVGKQIIRLYVFERERGRNYMCERGNASKM